MPELTSASTMFFNCSAIASIEDKHSEPLGSRETLSNQTFTGKPPPKV